MALVENSPSVEATPPLLRFLDGFLQERNIKWLLAIGSLILLGSSVMLVANHWNDYTPTWQLLIMLAYTGMIYLAGQWSYYRLALRRTGTGLMVLTVLLLPALFFALAWLQHTAPLGGLLLQLMLAGVIAAFAAMASTRIFQHFLRGSQPTFLVAYLALALSYALIPMLPVAILPWVLLLLWAVMCVGTVKVNRHVFWLTEEYQAPRIFGFFPIALLGGLFLGLVALYGVPQIAPEWLGLGCVLVAVPVLLTADVVAAVFAQRSGELIEQRPAAIMLPLLVGLILTIAGIALSAAGLLPGHSALALTPTAALAAVVLTVAARRSGKTALVWAALIAATLAYNFSPFYFSELARQWVAAGAEAVAESRLPYPFYGLSYFPWLLLLTFAAVKTERLGASLFSQPLRWFSSGLAVILLLVAFGHSKALLPVAASMLVVLALQAVIYRQRWLVSAAALAFIVAAWGVTPFSHTLWGLQVGWNTPWTWLLLAASALLIIGYRIDLWRNRLPEMSLPFAKWLPGCQLLSLLLTLLLAVEYLPVAVLFGTDGVLGLALTALLIGHSLRWLRPLLSLATLVFLYSMIIIGWIEQSVDPEQTIPLLTLALLGQWLLDYPLRRFPNWRISRAFAYVSGHFAAVGLLLLVFACYLPLAILDMLGWSLLAPGVRLLCAGIAAVWIFDAARRYNSRILAILAYIAVNTMLGAVLIAVLGFDPEWLPLLWVLLAGFALVLCDIARRIDTESIKPLAKSVYACALLVLGGTALSSLLVYTQPLWLAGGAATLSLLAWAISRGQPLTRNLCVALVNWQLLVLTVLLSTPLAVTTIGDLTSPAALAATLPLAMAAALSALLWQRFARLELSLVQFVGRLQRWLLYAASSLALWLSTGLPVMTPMLAVMAIVAFLALTLAELSAAWRRGDEWRVWSAEIIAGLAVAYLGHHQVITFGQGWSPFYILAAAVIAWVVSVWVSRRESLAVFSRPLRLTALALPAVAVGLALYHHLVGVGVSWLGRDSLALFLAGAGYAWFGYEYRRQWAQLLTLIIANLALLLLWRELSWSDPQFYLIPLGISILLLRRLLNEQLPPRFHAPLNYLGALVILVSPLFHIISGSWLHIFSLMLLAVTVIVVAIGLRIRALIYTGTAFLVADLVAMVVRGGIDNPSLLWLAGLLLGASVIALGALAERNREGLSQRLRVLSAALESWQ